MRAMYSLQSVCKHTRARSKIKQHACLGTTTSKNVRRLAKCVVLIYTYYGASGVVLPTRARSVVVRTTYVRAELAPPGPAAINGHNMQGHACMPDDRQL